MKLFKPKGKTPAPHKTCIRCGRLTISMTDRCMGSYAKSCSNLKPDIIKGWWRKEDE